MKIKKRIFRKCAIPLLILIEEEGNQKNINQIARKTEFQFGYVLILVKLFLKNGLIEKKKFNKKEYHLYLTEKGKKIVNELREIIGLLE